LFLLPQTLFAASLSLSPATIAVHAGDTVTERIYVTSTDQALNAVSANMRFSQNLLEVTSVSKGSVLTLWVQEPAFSNTDGTLSFSGVVPNPGYLGAAAKL